MSQGDTYNQLKKLLADSGGKFNILEEQIDIDLQVEFFEMINDLKKDANESEDSQGLDEVEKSLKDKGVSIQEKKQLLVNLSGINDNPEAYRIIERFVKTKDNELENWATLALQHSRINLESHFLDEQQVFISTGLGGKQEKLRYFIVCKFKEEIEVSDAQKKIVITEFEHIFGEYHSVIEKIKHRKQYFSVLALIPIDVSLNEVIKAAIDESNNYGDFIHSKFLVTNVKILHKNEIEQQFKKLGL
jgi:hypothetical protein